MNVPRKLFLLVFSTALFASDSGIDFNSKLYFIDPMLNFNQYAKFDNKILSQSIEKINFNGKFSNVKISGQAGNDFYRINIDVTEKYKVREIYNYVKKNIQNITIKIDGYEKKYSGFRAVESDIGIKIAYEITETLEGKMIRKIQVMESTDKTRKEIKEILEVRSLDEEISEEIKLTRINAEDKVESSGNIWIYEKWISLLEEMLEIDIVLYGIWKTEMINYIFDVKYCILGILTGTCSNASFDKKTNRGSFTFTDLQTKTKTEFEYMKNDHNFFLRPKAGEWVGLSPFCEPGYYPRIKINEDFKAQYKCI